MMVYRSRGFLPYPDPLVQLPDEFSKLDELGDMMPNILNPKELTGLGPARLMRNALNQLEVYDLAEVPQEIAERLMMLYSYFASAYVWADGLDEPMKRLPPGVAVPLVKIAERVGRPPILGYASYCLNNWRRFDDKKPIELGNIELLQEFRGLRDEQWFILIHVDIEAKAAEVITGIGELQARVLLGRGDDELEEGLEKIVSGLQKMNATLNRMPEECSPDVYFNQVRPYIFGFEDVVYEGVSDKPFSYRGETGAQSSIVPVVIAALGITHRDSILTVHLNDMRQYMPPEHRNFIAAVEGQSRPDGPCPVRPRIEAGSKKLKGVYNDCVNEVHKFREKHLEYAVEYIHKKVTNPTGTGGTPYLKWLSQLAEETKEHLVK